MACRFRLLRQFSILLTVFILASCATASVTPEQMSQIETGEQSAIILSYLEYDGLYGADVDFVNVDTLKRYNVSMHGGSNWVNAGPDIAVVPPGRYRIMTGRLYAVGGGYDRTANMPLLGYWFKPFDVAAGEVVDVGALTLDEIELKSLPGDGSKLYNLLLKLGDGRESTTYIIYNVDFSDDKRVQKMLESKYPNLIGKPIKRKLEMVFGRKKFEDIIIEANQPDEAGQLPTTEEAQREIDRKLQALIEGTM